MLKTVRATVRLILFFLCSLITVLLVGIGNLLIGFVSQAMSVQWKNLVIKCWAWLTAKILGMKINLKGTPPAPPFFLVSNHLSYIDVVPLWLFAKGTFVAKSEVKGWPFFGWATRTLGVLFIDRKLKRDVRRMNQCISDTISEQQGIMLFPEGTSTRGDKVHPFNAPLLKYPASQEMPVSYVTLSYRSADDNQPAYRNICWWGDMAFFPHFWNLLTLSGFEVDVTFGETRITKSDRKELAKELRKAVAFNFVSVFDSPTELESEHLFKESGRN